jgi:hypothetical protein
MGRNMSLKIHFSHSHFDFFPLHLGEVSDEHGKRFHQDVFTTEKRCAGQSSQNTLANYCWNVIEDMDISKTNELQNEAFNESTIVYFYIFIV